MYCCVYKYAEINCMTKIAPSTGGGKGKYVMVMFLH